MNCNECCVTFVKVINYRLMHCFSLDNIYLFSKYSSVLILPLQYFQMLDFILNLTMHTDTSHTINLIISDSVIHPHLKSSYPSFSLPSFNFVCKVHFRFIQCALMYMHWKLWYFFPPLCDIGAYFIHLVLVFLPLEWGSITSFDSYINQWDLSSLHDVKDHLESDLCSCCIQKQITLDKMLIKTDKWFLNLQGHVPVSVHVCMWFRKLRR